MDIITKSAQETCKLGENIADYLKKDFNKKRGGRVIALVGTLGSGKTTFTQCFAKSLGVAQRVTSPTFVIMREYEGDKWWLYHVDLYRLDDAKEEFESLGIKDLWKEGGNVIAIEWAEKVREFLPKGTIWIKFEVVDEDERHIKITPDIKLG